MPYVFRIHKQNGNAPHPAVFGSGWEDSAYLTDALLGEIVTGQNVGRMGTSIPSIFARPMLFQTAFNTITPQEYSGNGVNQKIVSEALDMLEFLSQNARSQKLSIEDWVAATQLATLRRSKNPALRRLADAIDAHLGKIGNPNKITLFFWEDTDTKGDKVKVLIGGTSLSTLVFTSPNWSRKMKECGWTFKRTDGSKFFVDDVKSLAERNSDFQDMIFNLRLTYDTEFQAQCGGNTGLNSYIWNTMQMMHNIPPVMDRHDFDEKYPAVDNVYAGQIPIPYKTMTMTQSGYRMKPTSKRYEQKTTAGGQAVNVPVPLALNDNGVAGVEYVDNSYWLPTYSINEAHVRTTPSLIDRDLPGDMGIKYPYVTVYDFLEDSIIEVPGAIDNTRFLTLFNGDSRYLVPLKQQFFDFFDIKDLEGVNSYTGKPLVEIKSANGKEVVVTINVPITDPAARSIPLSKTYSGDAIIKRAKSVEIAFFPFYRVVNRPSLDVYAVMLSSEKGASLNFYKLGPTRIEKVMSEGMERTAPTLILHATKHYEVKSTIDIVEVVLPDNKKAIVIPKMTEINMGTVDFKFAIDFGTSNTFIAYKKVGDNNISTLDFGVHQTGEGRTDDTQTVYLYSPDNIPTMIDTYQREFMLPTLGQENSIGHFPIKTSVCEVSLFENQPFMKLFGNVNIGFKFQNEIAVKNIPNAKYYTKLKWALEENPGDRLPSWRVLAFCKEILWLVKNKALLNGGNDDFKVMLTFPESMIDRSVFLDQATDTGVWNEAAKELGLDSTNMFDESVTESEAPYYMVVEGNDNMLNVDIGGGTTDMFLVRRLDKVGNALPEPEAVYTSVKFAADDLWGDGAGARQNTTGNNGFCQYLSQKIKDNGGDISGITNLVDRSADIMAALFSNEDKFKTSLLIRQDNVLRSVILLHYTGLLFSIARLLQKMDAGIPRIISFTGMGSKYLSLISTNNARLTSFTEKVLKMLTGCRPPANFKVDTHYKNAKEVTAKGALSKDFVKPAFHIPQNTTRSYTDLGADSYPTLTYAEIRNGKMINAIRKDARKVFDQFIQFVESSDFGKLTGDEFQISIPKELITELKNTADQSFNNVQGGVPAAYDQRTVTDNLFFWFLKDSLCKLSLKFKKA